MTCLLKLKRPQRQARTDVDERALGLRLGAGRHGGRARRLARLRAVGAVGEGGVAAWRVAAGEQARALAATRAARVGGGGGESQDGKCAEPAAQQRCLAASEVQRAYSYTCKLWSAAFGWQCNSVVLVDASCRMQPIANH